METIDNLFKIYKNKEYAAADSVILDDNFVNNLIAYISTSKPNITSILTEAVLVCYDYILEKVGLQVSSLTTGKIEEIDNTAQLSSMKLETALKSFATIAPLLRHFIVFFNTNFRKFYSTHLLSFIYKYLLKFYFPDKLRFAITLDKVYEQESNEISIRVLQALDALKYSSLKNADNVHLKQIVSSFSALIELLNENIDSCTSSKRYTTDHPCGYNGKYVASYETDTEYVEAACSSCSFPILHIPITCISKNGEAIVTKEYTAFVCIARFFLDFYTMDNNVVCTKFTLTTNKIQL